jgi:predicted DCC family thiol-disulfide oxidoreductase YuxK
LGKGRAGGERPLEGTEEHVTEATNPSGAYTLLYDGECPLCLRAVSRVEAWDREGRVGLLPTQDPGVGERFPWLSEEALMGSIHLVGPGKETWEGVGAVEELARILPRWRWAAWLFRLPLVRPLGRRVYGWVARHRYRMSCDHHCS